jgi:hypothetical protein
MPIVAIVNNKRQAAAFYYYQIHSRSRVGSQKKAGRKSLPA